jgi:hypothetical protein
MTTVAVNKNQIAADLQATHNGGLKFKIKTKIIPVQQPLVYKHPFYVGLCGNVDSFSDIISWFADPTAWKKPPSGKGGDFVVLTADKKIFTFANPSQWIPVNQPYYAVGSGMNYAMAAMASGKTPYEAVKIAAKFDPNTGMGFEKVNIA